MLSRFVLTGALATVAGCGFFNIVDEQILLLFEEPEDGAVFSFNLFTEEQVVTITAIDPTGGGITSIICYVDDQSLGELESPPYSWEWVATLADTGSHSISAIARNDVGDEREIVIGIVIAKPDPHFIQIPEDGAVVALNWWSLQRDITISAEIPEGQGVASVSCIIDTMHLEQKSVPPYSWTWNATIEDVGSHSIQVVARDIHGNEVADTVELEVCTSSTAQDPGTFVYPDFSSTAGLILKGDAAQQNDALRLTPSAPNQTGLAWFRSRRQVKAGFETVFEFRISDLVNGGGDNFAFVVQNIRADAYSDGGYGGIWNGLAIEFDTELNPEHLDPSPNHISIQPGGLIPHNYSLGSTNQIPNMSDGEIHTVRITYVPGTMIIYMDDLLTPVLNASLHLDAIVNLLVGQAWVGFAATTGDAWENHDILSWGFRPAGVPSCDAQ
ncbi:MAG: hypothetical protein IH971_10270 [Candidatus Marinimicrobia bacterium]|nr:hypothetical protein [Candidatus Neomarinimicrobiota bacterium]